MKIKQKPVENPIQIQFFRKKIQEIINWFVWNIFISQAKRTGFSLLNFVAKNVSILTFIICFCKMLIAFAFLLILRQASRSEWVSLTWTGLFKIPGNLFVDSLKDNCWLMLKNFEKWCDVIEFVEIKKYRKFQNWEITFK